MAGRPPPPNAQGRDADAHGRSGQRFLVGPGSAVITVVANGRPVQLPDGATVTALLDALGIPAKSVAAMEHNGEPVPRAASSARRLADGDRIELVRAVAGG